MEQGNYHLENHPESLSELDLLTAEIMSIFGKGTQVNIRPIPEREDRKREIIVERTLSPGFVEGGQKIQLRLYESKKTIANDDKNVDLKGFSISAIRINDDTELFDDFDPITFLTNNEMDKVLPGRSVRSESVSQTGGGREEQERVNDLKVIFENRAVAAYDLLRNEKIILAQKLESANDLVVLLHEQGHHDNPINDIETGTTYKQYKVDLESYHPKPQNIDKITKHSLIERWLFVMNNEIDADIQAMQRVANSRKSRRWARIFPSDCESSYIRLHKALEVINVIGYQQAMDGWYVANIDAEQRERLHKFYPSDLSE